jgi:hypothetical protein
MYRCAVLQPQVDPLTCANTSTRWHSQAPDELTRAPFATQSATHFDLAGEPSCEVIDIQFDDQGGVHSRSQSAVTPANCLRSARRDVQGWASNATQTLLEGVATVSCSSSGWPRTRRSGRRWRRFCPVADTRVRADSLGGTSTTCSPSAISRVAMCRRPPRSAPASGAPPGTRTRRSRTGPRPARPHYRP